MLSDNLELHIAATIGDLKEKNTHSIGTKIYDGMVQNSYGLSEIIVQVLISQRMRRI
jgi:hypothetical protein